MNNEEVKPIIVPTYAEEKKEKRKLFKFFIGRKKKAKKPVKKEYVLRKTPTLLPFLDITDDYILLKNDAYMDILQITPKDLQSLTDDELNRHLLLEARTYRSYTPGYKIIALNFPSNTERQQQYWLRKKERATNSLLLRFIERKLFELRFLEQERPNREFFLFLYASSVPLLEDAKNQLIRGMRQSFSLQTLSIEKRQDVLFLLNNQNSKL
ncbi:hypothetical protein P9B03_02090 [Metasolibacillus meyeri]|uniref:Uncharacterized protein n=1 Tax=Metasolibacillus meyeri TaxID=1071052 RepID=A0AAW9NLD7_9BACL|nr:hypothetical protein [Metasolibacillus meyeri]MEC1177261.1 hypothetical protein [Metasolibacillus meyeri]